MLLYNPASLLPSFRTQRVPVTLAVATAKALNSDTSRVSIWFPSSETTGYYIMPENFAAGSGGIFVAQNSQGYEIKFADHPGIVGNQWYVRSAGGAGAIVIYTSSFVPREN